MDILQALQNVYTANATLSTELPIDDTVPLDTEGVLVLTQSITLASASPKVLVKAALWGQASASTFWGAALFRGSICIDAKAVVIDGTNTLGNQIMMSVLDAPGAIGPHAYSVRVGSYNPGGSVLRLNGTTSDRVFGGASKSTLTLLEIG
jgi:hypothetical protein